MVFECVPRTQRIDFNLRWDFHGNFGFLESLKCGDEKSNPVELMMILPPFTDTELTATCDPVPPDDVTDTLSALAASFTLVRPHSSAASEPGIIA
jgi:hypothetical protein